MTNGDVARRAGVRQSAIRYYERIGLMPRPPRASGRRSYDGTAVDPDCCRFGLTRGDLSDLVALLVESEKKAA